MSKLTKAARDNECTLRFYPYCNHDTKTTVFAHAPSASKGLAIKSEDWWGADSCSVCHDIADGRRQVNFDRSEILAAWMRGIHDTLKRRIDAGLIIEK